MNDHDKYRTHHASRRLRGFDYTTAAAYFITICADEHLCLFGEIAAGRMHLNATGRIIEEEWRRSEDIRDEIALDAYVIMPNHLHGIVVIAPLDADAPTDPHAYRLRPNDAPVATHGRASLLHRKSQSLGSFVAGFKAAVTSRINRQRGTPGDPIWQRNYHDRILRDEREWRGARRYIERNPVQWDDDVNHPTQL